MSNKEWVWEEVSLGGYADIEDVIKEVAKIKEVYPEATGIMVIARPLYDSATNVLEYKRYKTEEERAKEKLREKQAEEAERQQFLKLKAKFEGKENG